MTMFARIYELYVLNDSDKYIIFTKRRKKHDNILAKRTIPVINSSKPDQKDVAVNVKQRNKQRLIDALLLL